MFNSAQVIRVLSLELAIPAESINIATGKTPVEFVTDLLLLF